MATSSTVVAESNRCAYVSASPTNSGCAASTAASTMERSPADNTSSTAEDLPARVLEAEVRGCPDDMGPNLWARRPILIATFYNP